MRALEVTYTVHIRPVSALVVLASVIAACGHDYTIIESDAASSGSTGTATGTPTSSSTTSPSGSGGDDAPSAGGGATASTASSDVGGSSASGGGDGGSGAGDVGGGGTGPTCDVDDCPPSEDPCLVAACEDDACTLVPVEDGPASAQVTGDCKVDLCDGGTLLEGEPDPDDLPEPTDCHDWVCGDDDVPVIGEIFEDVPCGAGLVCNAAGVCAGCDGPEDCPDPANPTCQDKTCDVAKAECGFIDLVGTEFADPNSFDCVRDVCGANGSVATGQPDPDDTAATDSNSCTIEACSGTTPIHTPVAAGTLGGVENGVACNGVCQGGIYAGQCGYSLYSRTFPGSSTWSRTALSTWGTLGSDGNAPPPRITDGSILSAEQTTAGRLMVWHSNGNYYEFRNGAWQAPVATTTRFPQLPSAQAVSASASGDFQTGVDVVILASNESPPRCFVYDVPFGGGLPVHTATVNPCTRVIVEDPDNSLTAPPQDTVVTQWSFGDQRGVYGVDPLAHIAWKSLAGIVYQTVNVTEHPNLRQPQTSSELWTPSTGTPPAANIITAAYKSGNMIRLIGP